MNNKRRKKSVKAVLNEIDFSIPNENLREIKDELGQILKKLKEEIRKSKTNADVFVGGSFAKNTITMGDEYDIDIFVRFDKSEKNISERLEKIVEKIKDENKKMEKMHGSRDYFRIYKNRKITFEIIPVLKVKKPIMAENVTDLSYFHVNYVKRKMNSNRIKDLQLLKAFCKAQGVYGAESYIQGFSGYALECLIIYYASFENLLKAIVKLNLKKNEKIVIDPDKKFKNKNEILIELNESKTLGPIVLVDPTWKERNVLAALSEKTLMKFQKAAKKFLKNPSKKYFEISKVDLDKMKDEAKKKKLEFIRIKIKTDRQEGDIAGTKIKKFANFLEKELEEGYKIKKSEFEYDLEQVGYLSLILDKRKEVIREGPPIEMKKAVKSFKRANRGFSKRIFKDKKKGKYYVKERVKKTARDFLNDWISDSKKLMNDMGIVGLNLV